MVNGLTADTISYLLTVTATGRCRSTDVMLVTLLKAPVIPNTFTPNGDGINENWTIQYLDAYPNCKIQVFNRNGQVVYEANGYQAPGWDGKYKGKDLPFGTYYYVIEPGSGRKPMTGYVTLIK
jgi:gliding motility-associated-like protein